MALASYEDANGFLDAIKISYPNDEEAEPESRIADRVVRAALFPVFGALVKDWSKDGPTQPPEIITDIAAMLMAAYKIKKIYYMEDLGEQSYPNDLEKRAMDLLSKVRSGEFGLDDENYRSGTVFSQDDFLA